ncbi:MAG TPA: hypothetical protein VHS09_07850, partial [Polyangiaceae bacterium]|nr:hypothetical protein [Polyangiaceae bacterium]
ALGAAADPVLRMLGDTHDHVCKCGMPAGKCGCPECDRAEKERLAERRTDAAPTLKRHCDDGATAMPLGDALSAGILTAATDATLPVPRGDRLPVGATTASFSFPDDSPPTPPPRTAPV